MRRLAYRLLPSFVLASALLGLAACSPSYSPNVYASAAAQQANVVDRGVIVGVRQVVINPNGTVGAAAGGAAGGVTGGHAASGGLASALSAIGGALVGGIAGSATEQATADVKAYAYIVQESGGKLLSVTQADREPLPIGAHVLVITGKQARVVRDYTVELPKPAEGTATEHEPGPQPVTVAPLAPPAEASPSPQAPQTSAPAPSPPEATP